MNGLFGMQRGCPPFLPQGSQLVTIYFPHPSLSDIHFDPPTGKQGEESSPIASRGKEEGIDRDDKNNFLFLLLFPDDSTSCFCSRSINLLCLWHMTESRPLALDFTLFSILERLPLVTSHPLLPFSFSDIKYVHMKSQASATSFEKKFPFLKGAKRG